MPRFVIVAHLYEELDFASREEAEKAASEWAEELQESEHCDDAGWDVRPA